MNLRYLGDALDHWKGSLFEQLQVAGVLEDFAVDAMETDAEDWQPFDTALLATLLRIEPNRILGHREDLALNRSGYFDEITHKGDLFLDPDTGIATGKVLSPPQYVFPKEVHELFVREPSRVLAVYQHIRAQRACDRVQQVLTALTLKAQPFSCCAYESGTVAMLFLSRQSRRIDAIHIHLGEYLGRHASRRIHCSHHLRHA
jgi:hypothetical protein